MYNGNREAAEQWFGSPFVEYRIVYILHTTHGKSRLCVHLVFDLMPDILSERGVLLLLLVCRGVSSDFSRVFETCCSGFTDFPEPCTVCSFSLGNCRAAFSGGGSKARVLQHLRVGCICLSHHVDRFVSLRDLATERSNRIDICYFCHTNSTINYEL